MSEDAARLIEAATGCPVPETDMPLLSYLSETVRRDILTDINQSELPDGLSGLWDRRTAAAYLRLRYQELLGNEHLHMVNRITEGKVTVQLAGSTPEERLTSLIGVWESDGGLLSCFRRIRW